MSVAQIGKELTFTHKVSRPDVFGDFTNFEFELSFFHKHPKLMLPENLVFLSEVSVIGFVESSNGDIKLYCRMRIISNQFDVFILKLKQILHVRI